MSTMRTRTALVLATAALALPLLSACADSDTDSDDAHKAAPTATPERIVSKESVLAGDFVADFRETFPKLASGRDNGDIAQNGADACGRIKGDDANRTALIQEVSKDFSTNGIKPNDDTVTQIMNLAVADACPERENNLKAVL